MRTIRGMAMITTMLAMASIARAQSGSGSADVSASSSASATVSADGNARQQVEAIRRRGATISRSAAEKAETKLRQIGSKVDAAARQGEERIAGRLATEFDMSTQATLDEKTQLGCGWGEWMIAHTLAANGKADVSVATLFELHRDGMGWGQIAGGMGLDLGETVSAAQAEARVARGQSKADGHVAVVHGMGSRHGAVASGAMGAGASTHGASATAGAGMSVSVPPVHVGH